MATKQIPGSRVVAITGAARGIGLATAKALHAAGCRVALGDIDVDEARRQAQALGEGAVGLGVDVVDFASFDAFLADAEQALGPLDVLHNNAGIMPIGPFLDESPETAERVLRINVLGCLNGMKAALPGMLERGRGHIINTASVAGKSPVPGGLSYAASKAAVVSATETARVEYAGRGLHFTCVMPSFTNTDLVTGTSGTRFVKNVEPEDVAAAVVDVVRQPRPDVVVPKILTGVLRAQPLLGRRLRDTMNHLIKADRAFLDIDQQARAGYEQRIGTTPPKGQLDAAPEAPAEVVDADEVVDARR